ncbi:hypothetical protein GCM10009839_90830 [Catenulispora yoronensis]|uniref:Uncharacterized protein n=1 Tax=Catenulispora yoronensis TaxID=450799 RepID=A0ABP5H534_9ACTN
MVVIMRFDDDADGCSTTPGLPRLTAAPGSRAAALPGCVPGPTIRHAIRPVSPVPGAATAC